jgi:hypothetical protein
MDIRRLLAVALFGIAGVLGGCSQKVTPVGGLTPVAAAPAPAPGAPPPRPGAPPPVNLDPWPRRFDLSEVKVLVYQPQVEISSSGGRQGKRLQG